MFHVYIITNANRDVLSTGHTDDIWERMAAHRAGAFAGVAATHGCKSLVWYEAHETADAAMLREREIKKWSRSWKLRLIEEKNADWVDLTDIPFWPLLEKPVTSQAASFSAAPKMQAARRFAG